MRRKRPVIDTVEGEIGASVQVQAEAANDSLAEGSAETSVAEN